MSDYVIRTKCIKVFPALNRLDFNLEDPEVSTSKIADRTSVYFTKMDEEHKLGGSKLTVLTAKRDEEGNLLHPNRLDVKWGRKTLYMGRVIPKNGGKEYYFAGLENNDSAPISAEDMFAAMGL